MRRTIATAALATLLFTALGQQAAQAKPGSTAAISGFSYDGSVKKVKDVSQGKVYELTIGQAGYAGLNLNRAGGETLADLAAPSFDYRSSVAGPSGGSPRLVVLLDDGGKIEVRPLTTSTSWTTVDASQVGSVDANGEVGTPCQYQYGTDWNGAKACHPGATVTDAFVVTDSAWLLGPYTQWIDDISFDGTTSGADAK